MNNFGFNYPPIKKLTAGSIAFADNNGAITEDNANLFWDKTNNRLGIGTALPLTALDVNGTITSPALLGGTSTTQDLTLQTTSGVGATGADMHFLVGNNGATEAMTILNSGFVGINKTNPTSYLHLVGGAGATGSTGTNATKVLNATGGAGGNGTNGSGGSGAHLDIISGTGGNGTGTGSNASGGAGGAIEITAGGGGTSGGTATVGAIGGDGGSLTFRAGVGGASNNSGAATRNPGGGGAINFFSGAGGNDNLTSGNLIGGTGGNYIFTAGGGGKGFSTSGNNTGGTGGTFTFAGGVGGTVTTATSGNNTGGNGGSLTISGGGGGFATNGATNTKGNGANLILKSGTKGILGTGGTDGLITMQIGATVALTIDSTYFVGIGSTPTVPAELLEIEDANAITGLQISNTATDGDPILAFALSGVKTFTMGVDDGDGDKFKIGTTAIGTNTRLTIDSAGLVGIGTDTPVSTLTVNGLVNLKNYTVATLPAGTRGDIAYVTDALAPAFLTIIVGGGAVVTPVFYNGTNWIAY